MTLARPDLAGPGQEIAQHSILRRSRQRPKGALAQNEP